VITQVLLNGILAGILIGLVSLGLTLIIKVTRVIHVAHAATYLVGAYVGLYLIQSCDVHPMVAAIVASLTGGVIGFLIERLVYLPLRSQNASSLANFLASLAIVVVVQNSIGLLIGNEIQTISNYMGQKTLHVYIGKLTEWQILTILVVGICFITTGLFLHYTRIGKENRAVGSDMVLSRIVGINDTVVILYVSVYASMLGGLAGFLSSYDRSITPNSGINVILLAITATIIGGIGSVPGAILGGLFIGLTRHLAAWTLAPQWEDAIVFMILIIFLIVRPYGIFGVKLRRSDI
jgi:branched-chain amino acid transport system permease protein